MVETRSGKMQDPAQERIKAEESAKPQPGATIGRDASSDPVVLNPNIDIPKYDGTEDPRPWIESLEEIGFLYHWADYIISRYAAMNMIGSAKTWLNLHKVSFTSWENFKSRLIEDFASDANKEEMRMRLNRIQQWNEPAIRFAEDILVLCNKVDPQMEEETKINWVIGGLKKEYSFALHLNPPKNTNELLEICKKLDLFEKNYQERAEKSKALYNGPRSPRPHHQEQWKNATSFRRPYQNTSKPQAPAPRYYQNTSKPQAPTPRYYQNKPLPQVSAPRRSYTPNPEPKPVYPSKTYNKNPNSNRNRTEDGRPICFKCNKPGHVARYCRVRIGICEALIDTGADLSVADLSTALNTGLEIINPDKMCSGPDGKELDIVGNIILNIKFDDKTITHQFMIMRTHLRIFILGRDFLKKMNAKIDCQREIIKYDLTENRDVIKYQQKKIKSAKDAIIPELSIKLINAFVEAEDGEYIIEENHKMFQTNGLRLARSLINVVNKETYTWITNPYPRPLKILKNQTLCFGSQPAEVNLMEESEQKEHEEPQFQINKNLAFTEKEQLKQVLERYEDLFSSGLGRSNLAKHRIDTEGAKPIKHKPYRVSAKEREIIKEQIDEMLRDGIIRPSSSPWSFPVILVKKRDGKYRFCVDYRKLNDVTVKDVYPIPRIDEVLDTLQGSKYFSAIDLKSGYWQVEVEEKDKEKTAFTTAHGLYEFNVMPFGLCNAPATFERNMENMLGNLRWQICLCYLDDVIIYSSDFSTHLKRIEAVLKCFREANLKLNNKKCQFAFEELEILGHITNQHGIKPAEHNIKAIRDFPRPKKIKEVQSFLGMCSYYRKFIKGFSKIADPLTSLIKKNVPFTWTENQEKAFQTLKVALINPPILGHFDPNAITYIHTDASNIGLGATLVQKFGDKEKVISYLSRTLSKPEQNYSTTEKECLAVVWSMSKLRPYLYGRHFKIVTDHHALCWLKNLKDPTGRLARWALKIQEYNFEIIHKSGKKHLDADGLSRGPLPENEWDEDYERLFLNQIIDEKDDFIENIKENLSGNKRSITQNFKEENGCLYKKNPNPEGRAWLLVVPKKRRKEVMSEYHNHMLNGHLGVARTTYRLKNKYYWPSMLKDVSEFVKTCHLCQSRKGSNHLPSGLLQPIPPANYPFERIGIDFVGPLPSTKRRRKWIIVLTDYYTKYAETKAVSEATVKEVSTFLIEHIILRHGAPRFLISDRGSQFTSNLMKEVMKMCKVKHCFTTSYHPQTNGLTERLNRTLINMISMYVNTDQKNWDEILPFITHAYNTTIQETTGYSPFFLLFGREPMSLLDDENIPTDSNMNDYDEYIENYLDKIARRRDSVLKIKTWHLAQPTGYGKKKMAENPNNRLQKFNGSKSAIRPESWIKLYDFENNSLKEDEKIKNLMYYLTDSALEWYADEIISNPAIKRWEVVKERLIQRFGSYNANPIVSASHRRLKREESIENYFQDKIRLLNQTYLTKEEKIHLLTDGLPNDWKDLIVAAQPTDATKWFHIAASIEQNRASIQFKPKNKIHLATKNNDNRKNVCPFWCPICSKKGIKIKHWVTDCEDYDPNYKKDRLNQNTSVKQVCGAPELLNVSTLTNTPTQGAFKLINISVEVNGIPAQAFVDTGATVSIINWRLFKRTRLQLQPNSDIHISQADGVTRTCGSLQTKVRIDKLIKPVTLHVMKNFKYPLLIGLDVASLFNLLIDVKDKTIYTKFDGLQNPILVNHLEEIREHELKKFLEHNRNVFCQHAIDLGKVAIQHKIITKSEQPISLRPYRRPLKEYEEIAEQVKELLEHKLIRTSDSPWAFPVVMVPKKDGNKRMCIDYRRLNEITLDDRQPLPHIQDMFDRLHGSRFFSTLDVAWGYWQIEMDPQSIQKTAFVTNDGHYEFLVMPFGLKNAASTFQRIIQHILGELLWKGTCSFQDDILVYTKTWQEHIELLSKVFDKLRQYNMKLKLSKCIFGRTEVKYLGHIISHNQLKPDPGKVKSIEDFPRPDTVKKVRQFMGLANYYRKFVKDFSKISFPLVRLTRKNQPFIWNEEVEESFAKLKMALSTKPVLAIHNPDYPSKVYTDASKYGIGAILTQIGPDNEEHVIAYYSKTLQPHQENYSAYEMECLAVIQATDHFHVYIENQPFEIITDHAALQWLFTMKKPKPKYFRWILSLSSKSCNIVHRSGKQQTHVDALSRLPVVNIATQELQEHQQNSDLSFLKNSHTHDGVNFGHHVTQKDQLAESLKTRAQGKEESSDSYIQDVLHLCRELDPAMMENEIIAHLTKGISEEIYQSMIILDIATIDEFIKWCRKIEASNKKRVNKRVVFDRLPNVAAIGSADSESMEDLVRRIVREEVHRALNPESTTPEPSSLKEIIREEIEKNVAAISKPIQRPPPRQSYPNQTRTFNQVPRRQYPTQTPIYNQTPPQRRTDEWRTHDNIPICFNCGRPGHVKRYCRERRQWTQRPEGHAPSTQEPQMAKIEQLTENNYTTWSMKMEAILDSKDLFEDVIVNDEPDFTKNKLEYDIWKKKNREAYSLILLSLSDDLTIIFRGDKRAKRIWYDIKKRFEGSLENKRIDLMLDLARLKLNPNENVNMYIVRAQKLAQEITQLGKTVTERELVRYIVEGLTPNFDTIAAALSINREISLPDLRQTLLDFEKKRQDRSKNHENAFRSSGNQFKEKSCFICKRKGHFKKDCWFNPNNKGNQNNTANKNNMASTRNYHKGPKQNKDTARSAIQERTEEPSQRRDSTSEYALHVITREERPTTQDVWIIDSAFTSHMTSHGDWIEHKTEERRSIQVAEEGRHIESTSSGLIQATVQGKDKLNNAVTLHNVLHVPHLKGNLMSIPSVVRRGNSVLLNSEGAYIYSSDDKLIGTGNFDGNMYTLNLSRLSEATHVPSEHCLISKDNSRTAWHRRLGHPSDNKLDLIFKNNLLKGLDSINGTLDQCDACSLGKMTKVPYVHTDSNQESYPFEAIYVDLFGPMRINSLGGSKYFLTIVDGFSRRIFVEFLKDKLSEAEVLKKFIVKRENELNSKLKRLRTDNGTEFTNKNLETFIESKGIKHELTTPYTPRRNGRVERANRTLLDKGRTLLADSQLPLHFWAEAVNTAAYLYNLTPTTNDPDTTPMEKWKGKKPSVSHIMRFGCEVFYKLENHQRHKLEAKSKRGIFVGYSRCRRAYRVFDITARVILETADIHFRENNNVISEEKQNDNNTDTDTYFFIQEDEQLDNHVLSDVDIEEPAPDTMINRQTESSESDRPQRTRTIPKRFDDYVLATTNETIPKDYEEAITCEDKKHWENAMLEEIQNMTVLSMAATKDSVIKLFDVKAAYLNGNIENTIFMEQPAGFVQDRNKVCKLNKSIYGLPQSGRSWYEKFSQVLHDCGLEKLKSDPCLFKWKNEDKYFYVGIYVDDFITVSDSEDTSNRFINKLRHHLEIKDVTCKGMFLGIKIIQDKEGISLQQSHYVQQILQKYGMENCKEVPTPGSKEINLDNHIEDDNCEQHTYQEALGMLMFLAVNTRPDIAYITSKLSQYSRQPKQMHWTAIKRVMRYLRGTIDLGVKFERGKTGILKSYADASWSTTHEGKSYGGYVLKLGEATIDWKSSKQTLVALSTMEAEMIAACESCCQIKWIINLLRELEEWNFMEKPTAIYTDSQSLINWISSPKQSSRCRHINRKYHFLRDCYESRDICLLYKPSQDLEADIFTKDLSRDQMKKHLESLSIVGIKPKPPYKPIPTPLQSRKKLSVASSFEGEAAGVKNPPSSTAAKLQQNYVEIIIDDIAFSALVDSGSSFSVISDGLRRQLKKTMFKNSGMTLKVADGKNVTSIGRCTISLSINGLEQPLEFIVLPNSNPGIILGWDFLEASNAVIDCGRAEIRLEEAKDVLNSPASMGKVVASRSVVIPAESAKLINVMSEELNGQNQVLFEPSKKVSIGKGLTLPCALFRLSHNKGKFWIVNSGTTAQIVPKGMCLGKIQRVEENNLTAISECSEINKEVKDVNHASHADKGDFKFLQNLISDDLSEEQQSQILSILKRHDKIFDKNNEPVKQTSVTKHKIETGIHQPIKHRPYRVSPTERQAIQTEVDKMLDAGIIRHSESPWSSPVILVKKKDGNWRFCVDYRRLNKVTKKDVYPLPRIDDTLDSLKGAKFYSSMDLRSGYWQIEVDEADREKTAFITPDGLYEFLVMPFGLCNAPATFERMMDKILKGLKWTMALCYLDDIVVYSKSFNEHLHRLEIILQCLDKAELRLNPKKCLFGTKRIRVFGHLVDSKGIYPDPEKIEAIARFPTPRSITDVRSFIGLCSYYRRFIENFAEKAAPLHEVLKKDNKFTWNSGQQDAFDSLKKALMSEPVLAYFEEQLPTELHTDASGYGIGAVLVQINDGKERPVGYASRTLSKAERNYSTTERECLAAIWAINKFRPYLFGREFVIVTDHHALCWLSNLKDPTGRLVRWALKLQEYNVTVVYKSGRKHQDADCLSRNPLQLESEEAYNDEDDDIPSITALTCFEAEQRKDPKISKLIEETERFGAESKGYEMLKGTLYKNNFDPLGNQHLLVVPRHLRLELLKSLHDAPTAGHLGFSKTYERVKNKYFWPGLLRDIRRYVAHCKECQRKKQSTQKPPGLLKAIPPATSPFQRVGMDLLGRFPKSDTGNKWIIVCTDYLTRFAITKALPTGEAKEAAKFLMEDVVLKHGAPREIITDRGRVFQSKLIAELTNQCSSIHRFTTAYHPQTNGLTERLNKTLANMIAMYLSVEQKDWDVILPYVTFAYNTAKQDTTGFTPFKLIHGREAETTVDTLFPNPHEDLQEDYSQKIASRVEETRQLARLETLKAQEKDKARYDSKHEAMDYNVGDLVWIFIPIRKVGLSEKLMKRYFGPYRVTRKLSDVTFEVEPVDQPTRRRQTRDLIHVLRMKPHHDPEDQADLFNDQPKRTNQTTTRNGLSTEAVLLEEEGPASADLGRRLGPGDGHAGRRASLGATRRPPRAGGALRERLLELGRKNANPPPASSSLPCPLRKMMIFIFQTWSPLTSQTPPSPYRRVQTRRHASSPSSPKEDCDRRPPHIFHLKKKSMADELRIPKLDGNNYYSWAIRAKSILIQKDIWDAIEPGFPSDTSEKQKRKDNLALSIILLAVEDSFLDDIGDCKRAIDAWQILEDIHTKYGLLHILQLLREFFNIVKRNDEDMKEYFARIMECHRKLAKCHHGFGDGELALIMLLGLPKSYKPLILSLEQQEEKLSTSMVKSKLLLEEKRQKQRQIPQEDPNSAFAVRREEDACESPCQERNKFEYDQPRNYHNTWTEGKKENYNYFRRIRCFNCGRLGHMARNCRFANSSRRISKVEMANNEKIKVSEMGDVTIKLGHEYGGETLFLENVLYVPELDGNILSVGRIEERGNKVLFQNGKASVFGSDGGLILKSNRRGRIYTVEELKIAKVKSPSADIWHRRLGYIYKRDLQNVSDTAECEVCLEGKMRRLPFPSKPVESKKTSSPLELIHSDVVGPISPMSKGGNNYFVTFIDDFTHYTKVYFMRSKSEVLDKFKEYKNSVENYHSRKIKVLRSDNGTEYVNGEFNKFLNESGIKRQLTVPRTPQQNGTAEGMNQTLLNTTRCILLESGIPKSFWANAVNTACYLRNKCSSKAISNKIPEEMWTERSVNIEHIRVFGCQTWAYNDQRRSKFDSRSRECVLIGYPEGVKGYKVWDIRNNKVFVTRNVRFREDVFPTKKVDKQISHETDFFQVLNNNFEEDYESVNEEETKFVERNQKDEELKKEDEGEYQNEAAIPRGYSGTEETISVERNLNNLERKEDEEQACGDEELRREDEEEGQNETIIPRRSSRIAAWRREYCRYSNWGNWKSQTNQDLDHSRPPMR
ncbi:hypothetical protein LAZ67_6002474, partial [Cordylochernes scorpioides]